MIGYCGPKFDVTAAPVPPRSAAEQWTISSYDYRSKTVDPFAVE